MKTRAIKRVFAVALSAFLFGGTAQAGSSGETCEQQHNNRVAEAYEAFLAAREKNHEEYLVCLKASGASNAPVCARKKRIKNISNRLLFGANIEASIEEYEQCMDGGVTGASNFGGLGLLGEGDNCISEAYAKFIGKKKANQAAYEKCMATGSTGGGADCAKDRSRKNKMARAEFKVDLDACKVGQQEATGNEGESCIEKAVYTYYKNKASGDPKEARIQFGKDLEACKGITTTGVEEGLGGQGNNCIKEAYLTYLESKANGDPKEARIQFGKDLEACKGITTTGVEEGLDGQGNNCIKEAYLTYLESKANGDPKEARIQFGKDLNACNGNTGGAQEGLGNGGESCVATAYLTYLKNKANGEPKEARIQFGKDLNACKTGTGGAQEGLGKEEESCVDNYNRRVSKAYRAFKMVRATNKATYEACVANSLGGGSASCKEEMRAENKKNRARFGIDLKEAKKAFDQCNLGGPTEGLGGKGNSCIAIAIKEYKEVIAKIKNEYEGCKSIGKSNCEANKESQIIENRFRFKAAIAACLETGADNQANASTFYKVGAASGKVTMYPNPSNGEVNFTFSEETVTNIEVMNNQGQLVEAVNVNGLTSARLNIETPGFYFIRTTSTTGEQTTERLVVR